MGFIEYGVYFSNLSLISMRVCRQPLMCFCFVPKFLQKAHLLEIPQHAGVRSFHINRADCISADNTITHRTIDGEIVTEKFLTTLENHPDRDIVMGVTSGASTPDGSVQDALGQIFLLKQMATTTKN